MVCVSPDTIYVYPSGVAHVLGVLSNLIRFPSNVAFPGSVKLTHSYTSRDQYKPFSDAQNPNNLASAART